MRLQMLLAVLTCGLIGSLAASPCFAQENSEKSFMLNDHWKKSVVQLVAEDGGVDSVGLIVSVSKTKAVVVSMVKSFGDSMTVICKTDGGDAVELKGRLIRSINWGRDQKGQPILFARVEVQHNGLNLRPIVLDESVPTANDVLATVPCEWTPDLECQQAKMATDIVPAEKQLRGVLTSHELTDDIFFVILNRNGELAGVANGPLEIRSRGGFTVARGFGSVVGQFGFQVPSVAEKTPHFSVLVDEADSLRRLGIPLSDNALIVQKKRMQIFADTMRPVQGINFQVTWSDDHKELYGFSNTIGEWSKLTIDYNELISPVVGEEVAFVRLKGKIAAYSPQTGNWDVLSVDSDSAPTPYVSSKVVTVQTSGGKPHYYTFAASSGFWTSPTDKNYQKYRTTFDRTGMTGDLASVLASLENGGNLAAINVVGNQITIQGIKHHVDSVLTAIRRELKPQPVATTASSQPTGKMASAVPTEKSLQVAARIRRTMATEGRIVDLAGERQKLEIEVALELETKLKQQRIIAQQLRAKLEAIEKSLVSREQNKSKIIRRRVEKLLDPSVDWNTIVSPKSASTASVQKTRPSPTIAASANPTPQTPVQIFESLLAKKKAAIEKYRVLESWVGEPLPAGDKGRLKQQLTAFKESYTSWKFSFFAYESAVRSADNESKLAVARMITAKEEYKRIDRLIEMGMSPHKEQTIQRQQVLTAESDIEMATERVKLLKAILTESPNLNPATLNAEQMIQAVQKLLGESP